MRFPAAASARSVQSRRAFTLIELMVVISIIAILIGLLFPALRGVQDQAKRAQAKNEVSQIVTAVNAFYTEYGRYPIDPAAGTTADVTYGPTGATYTNEKLLDVLRNITTDSLTTTLNPRQIVFISPPDVKDGGTPRAGIGTTTSTGQYFDPWGKAYCIKIDGNYDNQLANPYSLNAGATTVQIGVIAWSFGSDGQSNSVPGPASDKNTGTNADDTISWQ